MRMDGRKVKGKAACQKPPTISEMCKEVPKPTTPLETTDAFIGVKQRAPRKVKMSCRQRVSIRLNSLESIWYCIVVIVVTVFLLGDALRQYKHYKNLEWPDQPPKGELGLYGLLIFSAFALIVLFIPTQIFKVGNRANDQDKLGIIKARPDGFRKPSVSSSHIKVIRQYIYKIRGVSKHMGPIGATLHMLSAFCLLLPLMFLQSKAIENGLLPVEMIWKSEVAVISAPAVVFESRAEAVAVAALDEDSLVTQAAPPYSSDMSPNIDPFRVFMVTINYLNYMVPLFFYAIRYAEVFWVSHKGFAFLFSAQLMMNGMHYALGFIGMSIMYKLSTYVHGQYNTWEDSPHVAQPSFLILSFLSMNITVFLSAVTFYLFGYTRYKISESEVIPTESTDHKKSSLCILRFNGLLPHVGAFIVFIILVICKGFFIAEYFVVYRWLPGGDGRIMSCIVFDIFYLVMWFFMWVVFTIKLDWNFGFFSHNPHPHRAIDAQSDSDPGLRSSNSDLEMNSDLSKLNHFSGSTSLRQTSEESETSFGNNPNTSLLSHRHHNHDQTNRGLVEDNSGGRDCSMKHADGESIGAVNHPTPKKDGPVPEVVTSHFDSDDSKLLAGVSIEIDSPTVSSPMLPIST